MIKMSKNPKIILSYTKNFKKDPNLYFFEEYTQKIFSGFDSRFKKSKFFISIDNYKKTNLYSKVLFKKLKRYRYELSQVLNKIHNAKNNTKYWGILLDSFLLFLINNIIIDLKFISKIKRKKKIFKLDQYKLKDFYFDTRDFQEKFWEDNRQAYIRGTILTS